ncbi:carboxylic acid reductase [Mycobacterium sp. WUMAC-067]|uniref:carboxylic acid reductase n=1 Tax=unclassified Mycobacterium TaxID=2642494 RepID=UPI001CD9D798|nr:MULTISPECIES: carboxylic acid reductase [unclassified Mycobacterium]MCA2245460.1 carboxylic acid reductase [Mycobacterium sp. WUMAC-067]MCA2316982.1 carboxylic acid reductase [Mycobacterium sp. WUMAC-025]
MLTERESEKLAQRVGDLLANDGQFAAALPKEGISEAILDPGLSWAGLMRAVTRGYADRPALGQRAVEVVTYAGRHGLSVLPRFDTISYGQLWQRVTALAAALAGDPVRRGDCVATLGFCSVDYATVDMAVPLLGAVSVPLHAGAPISQLQAMVDETEPSMIACSAEYLTDAVELVLGQPAPARLVVFDYRPDVDDHREALEAAHLRIVDARSAVVLETLAEAVERGSALPAPPDPPSDGDRLAVIVYTSGSSGSPKGAMQPESLARSMWTVTAAVQVERGFAIPAITLNYMPMSHTAGRAMLYSTLGAGGTAYFAGKSDLSTILDDLALVRPTQLNFVPRIWELLHREFRGELERRDGGTSAEIEEQILADLRSRVLGGRYISALTGSAPISAELAAWVTRLLDGHLMNALGATESGSVIIDGKVQQPPVTDYKLVDVPELGYFSIDRPHPRGELLIKSRTLFRGYYKRPGLTAEVFDEDGFYRTGDIVAQIRPDEFRYVDRRNNVLKLAQGEFVTVSKLEAVYANCPFVHQIYVYGNGERSFLLAVVVPTEDALAAYDTASLKPLILRSMREAARRAELQSYEIPRDIIVESVPFSPDNKLLSGVRKPSRPNLKQHYGARLERLYAQLADAQSDRLRALREHGSHQPVTQAVCATAAAVFGDPSADPAPDAHFTELGGDSLSALTFANLLQDIFGVEVPVGVIISPASDMQSISDYIEAQRHSGALRPTFASVHGAGATVAHARDLTLDRFMDAAILDRATSLAGPARDVATVLLTGATGYLGRYLLLWWLDRMAAVNGTVICLVRGRDATAARTRLDGVFDSGDADLLAHYRARAADHLEVVAGDKSDVGLGLDEATWQRFADSVDLIIDPAALVNHMLPYEQLFGPNVVGTAELIKLALTTRLKPIGYVSSVAVGATLAPGDFTEDADIRHASATRTVDDTYANGYGNSKWAGEVLLREAHDLCGLPVAVFRCDMIMAETGYRGQLNVPDMLTRLILSIAATGLAPESFYHRDSSGQRARAHFDGLPVDFVAESVSTLSIMAAKDFQTFHVVNPHDDGIGLDEFVDWMVEVGCRIERLADHEQWYKRFESALRNLPERQRQASLLPLLQTYRHPLIPLTGAFAPTLRFQAAAMEADIGQDGNIPHIGKPIIEKYVTDLELVDLLDPDHRAATTPKES